MPDRFPMFGEPGEMTWQEVKDFLDHIRTTCMDERQALKLEVRRLNARIDRMTANCGWCQETRSPSGGFSPCPLHEGAERAAIGKDEITGRMWAYCPNCGRSK